MIDIDVGAESASCDGPRPDQIKFYEGEDADILDVTLFYFRLYLLNVNGFPDAKEQAKWSYNALEAACKNTYGKHYEGSFGNFHVNTFSSDGRYQRD